MREHRLLRSTRSEGRRRRPGYIRVTRPNELWQLYMTSVWVAEHGWCYLKAPVRLLHARDRRLGARISCRAAEATAVVDVTVLARGIGPNKLSLGSDNGTPFTDSALRVRLAEHLIPHRRGGYR